MNSISQEQDNFIFIKDRTGSLTAANQILLPLALEQCLINANDNFQATATSFNSALSCIYINYMYLYSKSFLVRNGFPTNFAGYIGNFQTDTPTVLTISNINQTSFSTLTAALTSIDFTFTNYIQNYDVSISLSGISTPQQLAYAYVDTITALNNNNLFPFGEVSLSGTNYTSALTGIPSIQLDNSYTTNPSSIFLTTATYTNNNGELNLRYDTDINNAVKFSYSSKLSAGLDDLVDIQITKNIYTGNTVIFCASKQQIYILTDDGTNVELVYSNNLLGYHRDLDFQNITSIVLHGDYLYIGDKHYNSIYKVDVSGFIRNNPVNSNRFIVDRIIGGSGGGTDITQFNAPEPQFVYQDHLYVFDRNNYYVKIYDLNLNYIRSINYYITLKGVPPITTTKPFNIAYYQGVANIYYLSSYIVINGAETFRLNELLVLDVNNLLPLYTIKLSFNSIDEILVDFKQSIIDPNIAYVATNKNLYKIFLSNFSQIGNFVANIYNINRLGLVTENNTDHLYVYQTFGKGFFSKFIETNTYVDLLTENNFDIYTLDELFVKSNENQTFVIYNKTFKKLFYNFYKLLTNIKARPLFVIQTNSTFNSRLYTDVEYITNIEFNELNTLNNKNLYVGENEIFSNNVLNRILQEFYILLTRGLSIINNKIVFEYIPINLKKIINNTTTTTTTVINNTSYPYIMTEQYNQSLSATYNSIILTENGFGITTETYQKPSAIPQKKVLVTDDKTEYVVKPYSNIDTNTTVASPSLNLPITQNESPAMVSYLTATRTTATGDFRPVEYQGEYSKYNTPSGNVFVKPIDGERTIETLLLAKQQTENIVFSDTIRIRPQLLVP